jgi:hypothetical protein
MRRTRLARIWSSIVVLTVALAATAYAQDVVEVKNGDHFTGTVGRLERGRLAFSTDAAGTISIAWGQVVTLTTQQALDVELASGDRYTGSITSPSPGRLVVQTASGPSPTFDLPQVIRITPIGASFRARTTGSIDFGATFTKADGARDYTLDAEASNRTRSYETLASLGSWLQRRNGENTLTRNDLAVDVRRYFGQRWFALATSGLQEDDELDLDWRVIAGGGVGRMLVQSNAMHLSLDGGLDYGGERYGGREATDHSAEVFGGVGWDYFAPNWATDVLVDATTYISLARTRARLALDAKIRREMFWNLYWSVNAFERFDSDPPGDRERSDLGLSLAVGWSF